MFLPEIERHLKTYVFWWEKKKTNLGGKEKTLSSRGESREEMGKSPLFHHQLLKNESKTEIFPWKLAFVLITKMLPPSGEFSNSESSFPTGWNS